MISPRWQKLFRDLWTTKGRMAMMVIAITVAIFGVGTILSSYTILTREVSRNYLGTNPAVASLEMDKIDDSLVSTKRLHPEIAAVEASSIILARIEKQPGEWMPLLLFIVKDFKAIRINTFRPISGAWPPPEGTLLLEREALPLLKAKVGTALRVQTPNGSKRSITISGLVHDLGLAPAWQEQTVYGYLTPATLAWLGEDSTLHLLKITLKDQTLDMAKAEQTVSKFAGWLKQQGYLVKEIRIPPLGKHPHQSQMTAILILLLIFSIMALVLSAILTAVLINGLLVQQVRQIGIMKAIGARSWQIASVYLVLIVLVGIMAAIFGLPTGIAAGRGFAKVVAQLLNITIYSELIPGWVYQVLWLAAVLVPLLTAYYPIIRATRITVREAINDYGISRKMFGSNRLEILLGKISLVLALRNTFRRKSRLLLTLCLLAAAGAMFITSLNVKTAWECYIKNAAANRHYDLEIRLNRPELDSKILMTIGNISGVKQVESWNITPVAVSRPDGLAIVRTYPDGGHGSLTMRSNPPGSQMLQSPLLKGRQLQQGNTNEVVLNHLATAFFPNVKVGDSIQLIVVDSAIILRVVGIVKEVLTPATTYVSPETFAKSVSQEGQSNSLRLALKKHDLQSQVMIIKQIEHVLEQEDIRVKTIISEQLLDGALNGHVYIFILALIVMALIMAVVGGLGLMSAMGTNVTERTSEFGIMRTIGAKSSTVLRNIILEGIFISLLSWLIAILFSLPLSIFIDRLLGIMSFRSPLPLTISPYAIVIWLIIVVLGAITTSAYPAWKASQLTIRETLTYI